MSIFSSSEVKALRAEVNAMKNSKKAVLARLNASPASFAVLGEVTDVVRDGFTVSFTIGGDVARATVDTLGDSLALVPVKRADQFKTVVFDLANETVAVDIDPETAEEIYDTYQVFDKGPKPTGETLAAGFNAHVA